MTNRKINGVELSHPIWVAVSEAGALADMLAHAFERGLSLEEYEFQVSRKLRALWADGQVCVRMFPQRFERFLNQGWIETHFDYDSRSDKHPNFTDWRALAERLITQGTPQQPTIYGYLEDPRGLVRAAWHEPQNRGAPDYGPIILKLPYELMAGIAGGDTLIGLSEVNNTLPGGWRELLHCWQIEQRTEGAGVAAIRKTLAGMELCVLPAPILTSPEDPSPLAVDWGNLCDPLQCASMAEMGRYSEVAIKERVTPSMVRSVEIEDFAVYQQFAPLLDRLGIPCTHVPIPTSLWCRHDQK